MAQTNLRPGDWICSFCANHNYASRSVCNRCSNPKPPQDTSCGIAVGGMGINTVQQASPISTNASSNPRPGDWYCPNPSCGNLNYASRVVCNRCSTPPLIGFGGNSAFNALLLQQAASIWSGGKKDLRPGDWMCPSCNNHNYASRTQCNRCQAQKSVTGSPMCLPPGYDLQTAQNQIKMRPGDWMCSDPACFNHNYASRTKCNKCGRDKVIELNNQETPFCQMPMHSYTQGPQGIGFGV